MSIAQFRFTALHAQDPAELGDFRLAARLGEGGMGQVFIASSPGGQPAAVKVIRPEFAQDAEFGQRFAREIQAAQRVRGAHLAPLLDADPHAEQPWLATAFVAGPTLRDLVTARGPLPAPQVLLLTWGIAYALADIHAARVVHRDLKPGNIMLDETGPKVIDFGIVKSMTQSVTYSSHSTRIGTPLYMSPEQAMGRTVGAPSDIFALGSTLYYLVTGHEAFGAENEWAVAHRIVADEPDLSAVPSGPLRDLITACLNKEHEERPEAPTIVELCQRELGDALVPGAWMRIDGARAAIQERTGALRELLLDDADPGQPSNPDPADTVLLDPPAPTRVAEPPEPKRRTAGVVVLHLVKLLLAAAVLYAATANPFVTKTWTSNSTGQQVSQVSVRFDWAHPWTAPSGITDETSAWMLVPIAIFGTAALIACGLLSLLELSSDSAYRSLAGAADRFSGMWIVLGTTIGLLQFLSVADVIGPDDDPAYDVRTVLEPGGWLLILANAIVAVALWHTGNLLAEEEKP
ncbi:serine/threonine-protein kinase [Streptomyces sp. NPDC058486]|uniref:serine/threonine-protein kinase n=1 Tax=unclassified Streptomyces TaxID=2593676 RepID=UPI00364D7436